MSYVKEWPIESINLPCKACGARAWMSTYKAYCDKCEYGGYGANVSCSNRDCTSLQFDRKGASVVHAVNLAITDWNTAQMKPAPRSEWVIGRELCTAVGEALELDLRRIREVKLGARHDTETVVTIEFVLTETQLAAIGAALTRPKKEA